MRGLRVAFRADSSAEVGTGHLMRCLALASRLRERDARCVFVCAESPGAWHAPLAEAGFEIATIPAGTPAVTDAAATAKAVLGLFDGRADWLVVDSYELGGDWERDAAACARFLMAIDDQPVRPHECDALLDQNLGSRASEYSGLVPQRCRVFVGVDNAILRGEFLALRSRARRRERLEHVLVSLGGAEQSEAVALTLAALGRLDPPLTADVVVGRADAEAPAPTPAVAGVVLHEGTDRMAELVERADVAIGAGGTSAWERVFLGLPSLTFVLADNQRRVASAIQRDGAGIDLGPPEDWTPESLSRLLQELAHDPGRLAGMSAAALRLMPDLPGSALVDMLTATPRRSSCRLRPMADSDLGKILEWRNSERVRTRMTTQHLIGVEEHRSWWESVKGDPTSRHLVFETAGIPLGVVNLDGIHEHSGTCSWGFYVGADPAPPRAGLAMAVLALDLVFGEMGMTALSATVLEGNGASLDYHRKLGFEQTGSPFEGSVSMRLTREAWTWRRSAIACDAFGEEGT